MKIGTITFHASHNYGSVLQAYALQTYIEKLGVEENIPIDYKIINLRIPIQRKIYAYRSQEEGIQGIGKRILNIPFQNVNKTKYERFEKFINERLKLTPKEYETEESLMKENFDFDYYVSGSDQLWNIGAVDFSWANYLSFTSSKNKISYAASFGPKKLNWTEEQKQKITNLLKDYSYLSVREEGSFQNVKTLIGKEPEILIDPTALLTKQQWEGIFSKEPIIKEDYLFFYTLDATSEKVNIVNQVAKKLGLKVVVSKSFKKYDFINGYTRKYDSGPEEFLNLIKYAKLVISSSFHGTVFSILFHKPFLAIDGAKDFRIATLLKKMELLDRSVINEVEDIENKCKNAYEIDFAKAEDILKKEREKSRVFLKKALKIGDKNDM